MINFKELFKNNEEWVAHKLSIDINYFEKLAKGQHPDIDYTSVVPDSRVTAEESDGR